MKFISLEVIKTWPRFLTTSLISISLYDIYKEYNNYKDLKNEVFKRNA